jgi:hypothetical protein
VNGLLYSIEALAKTATTIDMSGVVWPSRIVASRVWWVYGGQAEDVT